MAPFFSIIIPVYNVAPYLRECLDSVLAQTFTDWEAICVDDGSTDDSGAILDEYAAKDNRFRVFHQPNAGVSAVRNYGLRIANGDWLCAVDADDWISEDFLMDFAMAVQESDIDMVWSDYYIHARGIKGGKDHRCKQVSEENYKHILVKLLTGDLMGAMWNKAFSRKFAEQHSITFPRQRVIMWEDLWFSAAFLSHKPKVKYIQACGYHYVARDGSACRSSFTLEKLQSEIWVEQFLEHLDLPQEVLPVMQERRKHIKFNAYSSCCVGDALFREVYPEIRSLAHFPCSICHKVMFWLALHGMKSFTNNALCLIRKCRGISP